MRSVLDRPEIHANLRAGNGFRLDRYDWTFASSLPLSRHGADGLGAVARVLIGVRHVAMVVPTAPMAGSLARMWTDRHTSL